MSLWSTLPPGEQVVTEPAGDVDLALAHGLAPDQDERADPSRRR